MKIIWKSFLVQLLFLSLLVTVNSLSAQQKFVVDSVNPGWSEGLLEKVLTDTEFDYVNPDIQSSGYRKEIEQDYWARNELDFSIRLTAKAEFIANKNNKDYPFEMDFYFEDGSVTISSPIFAGTRYKNGIKISKSEESIRGLFPAIEDLQFFWGVPKYSNEDIDYIGIGCLADPSPKRNFKFKRASFRAKGDVNASYYSRKTKGSAEVSFLPSQNIAPSKLNLDISTSLNPSVSLRYQPVGNPETGKDFQDIYRAEFPVKLIFNSGFNQYREQVRSEYLAINPINTTPEDFELFKKAFPNHNLGDGILCFGIIKGNVDKFSYQAK